MINSIGRISKLLTDLELMAAVGLEKVMMKIQLI